MGACTEATLAPHAATAAHRQPLTEPRRRHRPSPADGRSATHASFSFSQKLNFLTGIWAAEKGEATAAEAAQLVETTPQIDSSSANLQVRISGGSPALHNAP